MQPVDFHIRTLLQEHDCVIIPGFGGLIARYAPVRVHPVQHTFTPPSKQLAFNANLRYNDGLLIMSISRKENLSPNTAAHAVDTFVLQVQEALASTQRYDLSEIGLFRKTEAEALEFEPYSQLNFLGDSFGLPELTARPILQPRTLQEMRTSRQVRPLEPVQKTKRSWWTRATRVAAVLTIAILQGSAVYMVSLDGGFQIGSLNPMEWLRAGNTAFPAPTSVTYPEAKTAVTLAVPSVSPVSETDTFSQINESVTADSWEQDKVAKPSADTTLLKEKTVAVPKTEIKSEPVTEKVTKSAPVTTEISEGNTKATTSVSADEHASYIIGGGFSSMVNAEKYASQVKAAGLEPVILPISPGSKLHRVAIAKFASRPEAVQALSKYTSQFGSTLWVLTN